MNDIRLSNSLIKKSLDQLYSITESILSNTLDTECVVEYCRSILEAEKVIQQTKHDLIERYPRTELKRYLETGWEASTIQDGFGVILGIQDMLNQGPLFPIAGMVMEFLFCTLGATPKVMVPWQIWGDLSVIRIHDRPTNVRMYDSVMACVINVWYQRHIYTCNACSTRCRMLIQTNSPHLQTRLQSTLRQTVRMRPTEDDVHQAIVRVSGSVEECYLYCDKYSRDWIRENGTWILYGRDAPGQTHYVVITTQNNVCFVDMSNITGDINEQLIIYASQQRKTH